MRRRTSKERQRPPRQNNVRLPSQPRVRSPSPAKRHSGQKLPAARLNPRRRNQLRVLRNVGLRPRRHTSSDRSRKSQSNNDRKTWHAPALLSEKTWRATQPSARGRRSSAATINQRKLREALGATSIAKTTGPVRVQPQMKGPVPSRLLPIANLRAMPGLTGTSELLVQIVQIAQTGQRVTSPRTETPVLTLALRTEQSAASAIC